MDAEVQRSLPVSVSPCGLRHLIPIFGANIYHKSQRRRRNLGSLSTHPLAVWVLRLNLFPEFIEFFEDNGVPFMRPVHRPMFADSPR